MSLASNFILGVVAVSERDSSNHRQQNDQVATNDRDGRNLIEEYPMGMNRLSTETDVMPQPGRNFGSRESIQRA